MALGRSSVEGIIHRATLLTRLVSLGWAPKLTPPQGGGKTMRYHLIAISGMDKFYAVPARDKTDAFNKALKKYGSTRVYSLCIVI